MTTDHDRVMQLFHQARKLPITEQADFLARVCPHDPALRAEVASLLEHHREPPPELSSGVMQLAAEQLWSSATGTEGKLPSRMGPFEIQERIASGGMGTVYRAVQDHPRRAVAIKVMSRGLSSKSMRRRFDQEAQVLARLQHPGIAQVFQAGTTDEGIPYMAMEYVEDARPLTDYAQDEKLPVSSRLELFAELCDAVEHGHEQGIIHRDLKPSNLLVGGDGQPKVIDYGVARATECDLTTLQTNPGQLIGTLPYMSPEQCAGNSRILDRRTDVYSLGVVLHELLTDRPAFCLEDLSLQDAIRFVSEQDPDRISSIDATLRGDLETIVGKAIQKEPAARYDTADALASDIRRYLAGEIIQGKPPSFAYLVQVFARRHRALVAALAAIILALLLTTIVSTAMYMQANRARDAAEDQRLVAEQRERRAIDLARFLRDTIEAVDPSVVKRAGVDNLLSSVAQRIEIGVLADQPQLEAELRIKLGNVYEDQGRLMDAEVHRREALRLLRETTGEESSSTLFAISELAQLLNLQQRYQEAEEVASQALTVLERTRDDADSEVLRMKGILASAYGGQGRARDNEAITREIWECLCETKGEDDNETLLAMHGLGRALLELRRNAEAEEVFRHLVQTRRRLFGETDLFLSGEMRSLVQVLLDQGKAEEAAPFATEAVKLARSLSGERSQATRGALYWAAKVQTSRNDLSQAEVLYRQLLDASAGQDPAGKATLIFEIAYLQRRQLNFDEAAVSFQDALTLQRSANVRLASIGMTSLGLGRTLLDLKRYAEAEKILLEAYHIFTEGLESPSPDGPVTARYLARLYKEQDRAEEFQHWTEISQLADD